MAADTEPHLPLLRSLLGRLSPEERQLLGASAEQINALPPEQQLKLGVAIAKFLDQRGLN
jgi:hypothetical protein